MNSALSQFNVRRPEHYYTRGGIRGAPAPRTCCVAVTVVDPATAWRCVANMLRDRVTDLRLDVGVDEREGEVPVELGPGAAQVVHGEAVGRRRRSAGSTSFPGIRDATHRQAVALLHRRWRQH